MFFEKLRTTLDAGAYRHHDRMIDRLIEQGYATTDISSALIHLLRGPEPTAKAAPATKPAGGAHPKRFPSADDPSPVAEARPAAGPPPAMETSPAREAPANRGTKDRSTEDRTTEYRVTEDRGTGDRATDDRGTQDRGTRASLPRRSPEPVEWGEGGPPAGEAAPHPVREPHRKPRIGEGRQARTGKEKGFLPVTLNVGHAQFVTPADIVGKIAGVTKLPAKAVGAIDIFEAETHVDVAEDAVELVIAKLTGVRMRDVRLKPRRVG